MTATMTVASDETGNTKTTVVLNVDTNATDFVTLSAGDSLAATANGSTTQPLAEDSILGEVDYVTSFAGESGGGTPYIVAFRRAKDASAPSSTCTLPVPFALQAPAAQASFSRSLNDITVTYAPSGSGDKMSYGVQGDCVAGVTAQSVAGDTGSIVIPKGSLIAGAQGSAQSGNCTMTITVTRQRSGAIDPHFAGGTIVAQQVRTVTVESLP
jgi:hypothetical protein